MGSDIVLCTLNAKYVHASFGLRCLYANIAELRSATALKEFDINQRPLDIAEALLVSPPRILGLSVYIWNARETFTLVTLLKRLAPDIVIVLGGPEVSHETEGQPLVALADYVICGEADLAFAELCRALLAEQPPQDKILRPALPPLEALAQPYDDYSDADVAHRVVYVEASRGCPYACEFCLSSLDVKVRAFPLDAFLAAMQRLFDRGVRQFKFVDRTFNLNLDTSRRILQFFLDRYTPGLFVHFEMVPDRLPEQLRAVIAAFPPGALQFEVGVQTLSPAVEQLVSRRQNHERMADNLRFLRARTGVHVHADLIVGLPGETMASFGAGLDALYALGPHEIQIGILKRLRGTPIIRHDQAHGMVYAAEPPYEILRTDAVDFLTMQRLRRFAKYWELFHNSGRFPQAMALLFGEGASAPVAPFARFLAFSDWLHTQLGRVSGVALNRQLELSAQFLGEQPGVSRETVRSVMVADYQRGGRPDTLDWLFGRDAAPAHGGPAPQQKGLPKRQARHLGAAPELHPSEAQGQLQPSGSVI